MNIDDLRNLDDKEKLEIGKCALIFLGGVAVGYGVKKVIDSPLMKNIKTNTAVMVREYFDPSSKYSKYQKQ